MLVMIAALPLLGMAPPPASEKAATARWMASTLTWGHFSTISIRTDGTSKGAAFGNPYSFADVGGVPYLYASQLDASCVDLFDPAAVETTASLALSQASMMDAEGAPTFSDCKIGTSLGDPENPPCARLVLTGTMTKLEDGTDEQVAAYAALLDRHPYFKLLPPGHDFFVARMTVTGIWLIDAYGGAAIVKPADYFAALTSSSAAAAPILAPPTPATRPSTASGAAVEQALIATKSDGPATARTMVSTLDWGVLSTVSSRTEGTAVGKPFGNPYSFADVDGVPYLYASGLDASMIDLFGANSSSSTATLALSLAALSGRKDTAWKRKCQIGTPLGDPENPPCARTVFTGDVSKVAPGSDEETKAKAALFAKHPSFANYPPGHAFYVAKMTITGIWQIAMFGGADIIDPADYFKAKPAPVLAAL